MNIPKELQDKIDAEADKHGFRIPYDGSNNFYTPNKVESFQAGAAFSYSLSQKEIEKWKLIAESYIQHAYKYLKSEHDLQVKKLDELGIPNDQFFEQRINCALAQLGEKNKRIEELEAINYGVYEGCEQWESKCVDLQEKLQEMTDYANEKRDNLLLIIEQSTKQGIELTEANKRISWLEELLYSHVQ